MKLAGSLSFFSLSFVFICCKTVSPTDHPDYCKPAIEWANVFFPHKSLKESELKGPVRQVSYLNYNYLTYDAERRLLTDTVNPPASLNIFSYNRKGLLEAEESCSTGLFAGNDHKSYAYDPRGRLQKALYTTEKGFCDSCFLMLDLTYQNERPSKLIYRVSATIDSSTYQADITLQYSGRKQKDTFLFTEMGVMELITNSTDTNGLVQFGLRHDPKENRWSYPVERQFRYNQKGRLLRREENIALSQNNFDISAKKITDYQYDSSGNFRSETISSELNNGGLALEAYLEHDPSGKEVKNVQYNHDSSAMVVFTTYDDRHNRLKRLTQFLQHNRMQPVSQVSNLYTEDGQLSQQFGLLPDTARHLFTDETGQYLLSTYTRSQYNEKGQRMQEIFFSDSGTVSSVVLYGYDAKGQVERRIEELYNNGKIQGVATYLFVYDRYGNMTRRFEYRNGILLHLNKQCIDYY